MRTNSTTWGMLSLLSAIPLLVSCDKAPMEAAELNPGAASMDIASGNTQSAVAGTELAKPIVVRVLNSSGQPVANQIVNFRVVQGGGSVFAGVALTNSQGLAQERWRLGSVPGAPQAVEARAVSALDGQKQLFATFTATALDATSVDTIPPAKPGTPSITTTAISADSFRVAASWGASTDAAKYQWRTGSNEGGFSRQGEVTGTTVTFTARYLSNANGYWLCVTAVDAAGNSSVQAGCNSYTPPASAPAPVVATVSVSPSSGSLTTGATQQLTATARDASGNVVTGKTFAWASSNTGVATVTSSGLVTAIGAGTATITASVDGRSGSSSFSITAPTSGGGSVAVNECASPKSGWIWCDDFEQNRLSSYFEYDNAGGAFSRVASTGTSSSVGMRARFGAGMTNAGSLKLAFGRTPSGFRQVDAGTANYREIYFRFYFKNASNWQGGGGDKLARAIVFAKSDWSEAAIAHVWSGEPGSNRVNNLLTEAVSGTDTQGNLRTVGYNDFAHLRWIGTKVSATPIFVAPNIGIWHCVESRVRLNDAGQSNGVFELWIDGRLEASTTGLNWLGSYNAYGLNALFLENYWNDGSPKQQERYFDNLVVSTQRIGCS